MNDEVEQRLGQLQPRGAAPELRGRVLAAVAAELEAAGGAETQVAPASVGPSAGAKAFAGGGRGLMAAAAALVLVGAGLNVGVCRTMDRRLAAAFGPPPVRKQAAEVALEVASVTDRRTGQWTYQRLVEGQPAGFTGRDYAARLEQAVRQLNADIQETGHEPLQKNPEIHRHSGRHRDWHHVDTQRPVHPEHRATA